MPTKIKLMRMGAKKQPTYRVVIQEERSKRDGRFIEKLGYYNPRSQPATIVLNQERLNYWLGVGAQPTESVGQLLKSAGITDKYYRMRTRKGKGAAEAAGGAAGPTATPPGEITSASTPVTEGTEKPVHVSSDTAVE